MTPVSRLDARAGLVIDLVPALPLDTLANLERMLSATVAVPTAAQVRHLRLGLLLDMLHDATGVVPSLEDYSHARAMRAAEGEDWPAASTLIAAYGRWLTVVRAGMRLAIIGSGQRVAASHVHARSSSDGTTPGRMADGPFRQQDVTCALNQCAECVHGRPAGQEYVKWAQLTRGLARLHGLTPPRLPTMKRITVLYGTFEAAVDAAERLSVTPATVPSRSRLATVTGKRTTGAPAGSGER